MTIYPAIFTPEPDDGGYTVKFVDLFEAITCGKDEREALIMAADCLEEVLSVRLLYGEDIPVPSPVKPGEYAIEVPAGEVAAKVEAALSGK